LQSHIVSGFSLRMKWIRTAALVLLFVGGSACAGTLAQFRTVFGDIEVELFDQDKPITVSNFIRYVESGRYRDGIVHRCVPSFVVQGGGFYVAGRGTTNAGIVEIPKFGTISNEFGVGRRFSNTYGTIAMAKMSGDTNSASSEWFINLADNAFLDAPDTNNLFTVFGRVVRGTNVLEVFKKFTPYTGSLQTNVIVDLRFTLFIFALGECPMLVPQLSDTNFVYVDVSLLNVRVQSSGDGTRTISWNSVSNKLNQVEFTAGFPPAWQTLVTTNGTGAAMSVIDSSPGTASRFYRVRVDY
jgi:cyclophilin family peptidyl-prolyl cis-trans isomerase